MEAEKRQHPRYSARNDGIEILSRGTQLVGKLENISKSGLAFSYIPAGDEKAESDTIDVMATGPARFYSINENLVLWARSEIIGSAELKKELLNPKHA